jgi:hypothetical protein
MSDFFLSASVCVVQSRHPLVLSLADQLQQALMELQYGGGGSSPSLLAPAHASAPSKSKSRPRIEEVRD